MKAQKSIVSIILAIVLVLGICPFSASAATNFSITSTAPIFVEASTSLSARQAVTLGGSGGGLGGSLGASLGTSGASFTWSITGSAAGKYELYTSAIGNTPLSSGAVSNTTVFVGVAANQKLLLGDLASVQVSDGTDTEQVAITVLPLTAGDINGVASLYKNSVKQPLAGVSVTIYNQNWEYIGSQITGADGKYAFTVPAAQKTANYYVYYHHSDYSKYFSLNSSETSLSSGEYITAAMGLSGYAINFVEPTTATVQIVDQNTNLPVAGVQGLAYTGSYWEFTPIHSNSNGEITLKVSSDTRYNLNKDGYFNKTEYKYLSGSSIAALKAGSVVDFGIIYLEPIPFTDIERNNLTLVPSTVTSEEVSNATLKIFSDQSTAINNATIQVTSSNGSEIKVHNAQQLRVLRDGVSVPARNVYTYQSGGKSILSFTIDIEPKKQYQISFGVSAPSIGSGATNYEVTATLSNAIIGKTSALINDLTVYAPDEIGMNDSPTIFGEAINKSNSEVLLTITAPDGAVVHSSRTASKGLLYEFSSIDLPANLLKGDYAVVAEAYLTGSSTPYATARDVMRVTDNPVSLLQKEIGNIWNKVSNSGSTPLTFNASVDGNCWSMDYHNLYTNLTLAGAGTVGRVEFVMETNLGVYRWNANRSGDTFSANLTQFRGSGKATLYAEVTKLDGTTLKYAIGKLIILIDPSGYVYNSKTGAKIEGAEVTLYHKDESGQWAIWPAADFMQVNPQITDNEGKYGWMVTEGEYQVRVTAKDYYPQSTTDKGSYGAITVLPERKDVNIALVPIHSGSTSSGGSASSGGGKNTADGSAIGTKPKETYWYTASDMQKKIAGAVSNKVVLKSVASHGIKAAQLATLEGYSLVSDSVLGSAVTVRIEISNPALVKEDLRLSATTTGSQVDKVNAIFNKYFNNKLRVIVFEQEKAWGQMVKIAAKIDLESMDKDNLVFYSYANGKYSLISSPNYSIDANGYVHFTTEQAGVIIISSGKLVKNK